MLGLGVSGAGVLGGNGGGGGSEGGRGGGKGGVRGKGGGGGEGGGEASRYAASTALEVSRFACVRKALRTPARATASKSFAVGAAKV